MIQRHRCVPGQSQPTAPSLKRCAVKVGDEASQKLVDIAVEQAELRCCQANRKTRGPAARGNHPRRRQTLKFEHLELNLARQVKLLANEFAAERACRSRFDTQVKKNCVGDYQEWRS